ASVCHPQREAYSCAPATRDGARRRSIPKAACPPAHVPTRPCPFVQIAACRLSVNAALCGWLLLRTLSTEPSHAAAAPSPGATVDGAGSTGERRPQRVQSRSFRSAYLIATAPVSG